MSDQNVVESLTFRKFLALRGPNIWTNLTVLEAWVDLAELQSFLPIKPLVLTIA